MCPQRKYILFISLNSNSFSYKWKAIKKKKSTETCIRSKSGHVSTFHCCNAIIRTEDKVAQCKREIVFLLTLRHHFFIEVLLHLRKLKHFSMIKNTVYQWWSTSLSFHSFSSLEWHPGKTSSRANSKQNYHTSQSKLAKELVHHKLRCRMCMSTTLSGKPPWS